MRITFKLYPTLSGALYRVHARLTDRLFVRGLCLHERAALAVVRWCLDRIQMWQLRHGPTVGCPDCRHYDSICDGCRAERKAMWG